ncbi:MAG: hydrogenase formation protein HypD [Hydrogenophilus sp.]|nr:hydrogenase formation protein HypD [Hydrogenophilus sp.]
MKYVAEFRDRDRAQALAQLIARHTSPHRRYHLMEFCGGHTHTIARYGLLDLLPSNIRMVHGPGCPVCVLPIGRIDQAIRLAAQPRVLLTCFGDCLRVPASDGLSLLQAKARQAQVQMVYTPLEAVHIAQNNPQREVVFFAIGFETTAPTTAAAILRARALGLSNFSVLCSHVLTPPAILSILESAAARENPGAKIDGFIGPAHVSTVIGSAPYEFFAREYGKPVVIAGFEPLDILQAILMLVRQINEGRAEVENQFTRAVTRFGNEKAKALVAELFELRKAFEWRGMGVIPYSALKIRLPYASFDAERRFSIPYHPVPEPKGCDCGAILRGLKEPSDCKLFGRACTPEHPIGACMVSSEGACAAYYRYRRRLP